MVVVVEGSIKDKEKYFKRGRSNGLVAGGAAADKPNNGGNDIFFY